MKRMPRSTGLILIVLLFVGISFIQTPLHEINKQFQEKGEITTNKEMSNMLVGQSLQFFGAAALGMRQAVASLLWVRMDEFFHNGEFEPIIPLTRLTTWLDPKQIDVYSTGAWHMDFNFVDQDQRSDKRYLGPALKLLREGIDNNSDTYDLYFDIAWMHYFQKIKDYDSSVYWLEQACKRGGKDINTGERRPRPNFVDRMLAHAYEKQGNFKACEKQWRKNIAEAEKTVAKGGKKANLAQDDVAVCKRNLGLMLMRHFYRYGDMRAYKEGAKLLGDVSAGDERLQDALAGAKKTYEASLASNTAPRDTSPLVDAGFQVTWRRTKPKVIEIRGKLDLVPVDQYKGIASESFTHFYANEVAAAPADKRPKYRDMCRVRFMLADKDYDGSKLKNPDKLPWEIDPAQTVLIEDTSVQNGKFHAVIDMSKDTVMYPFGRNDYKLIVWFDPQEAPDYIQDRIGWKGEGLTDKNYLDLLSHPGYRIIRREFILKKSDII